MLFARRSKGNNRNWHSPRGFAGGGSSAPVQHADCAATSSYRNESIETLLHQYIKFFLSVSAIAAAAHAWYPHKASGDPYIIHVTRQLDKYFFVYSKGSPRSRVPQLWNQIAKFCAYSLRSCALSLIARGLCKVDVACGGTIRCAPRAPYRP